MPLRSRNLVVPRVVVQEFNARVRSPRDRVLSGSAVLLGGLAFVTLLNFAYNLAVARYLGPIAFGHTTAVYTVLILLSAVTLSFQILTAKMVAQQTSPEAQTLSYRGFLGRAWLAGILLGLLLLVFRNAVTSYLNLQDSALIVLLAFGVAFYVPLGARRGYMQGVCGFHHLAINLVAEGLVRLGGSLLLIKLGTGVRGVVAANAAAVITAYFLARPRLNRIATPSAEPEVAFREGLQAAVFFAGQVVINNCDIVVVKHFFPAELAGVYAAVAMVGRVLFAFSWAIVSSMFPIAAETRTRKGEDREILGISLMLVAGICLFFILALRLAPSQIWTHLFGPQFGTVGGSNFRYLLVLYAVPAAIYALSVVLIAYEMSRKIANTGWIQLVVSGAVIAGIYRFHGSLAEVIWVQVAMMSVLLLCVAIPFVIARFAGDEVEEPLPDPGQIKVLRSVPEAKVITEFLKNDCDSPEFEPYRDLLHRLVTNPDLTDVEANRVRRALLNVRHGALWRELPQETQWYEVAIHSDDLHRLRVFPRAHWRKLALGDFGITGVSQRIVDGRYRDRAPAAFHEKISDLRGQLATEDTVPRAVLLIGEHENGPFTILDGNHRLVAALLASPNELERFDFYCGLSPKMAQCCWFQTNVVTLLRYGANMVRHLGRESDEELAGIVQRVHMSDANACEDLKG